MSSGAGTSGNGPAAGDGPALPAASEVPKMHLGLPSPTIAPLETAEWADVARMVERHGFDCLWHSNERFYREMFVRMTVSTLATSRIGIGGAIAEPYAVHPAVTAQSLATVHEVSGGRAAIAMGAGASGFPMMGIERRRPAAALRDAVRIVRGMLAGEDVTVEGEGGSASARGAHLHFSPPQPPAPVWIATRGDRTLRVAGEVADGALLATHAQPEQVAAALELVRRGEREAERAAGEVRAMARVDTCVHADGERAVEGSRKMVAKLLWTSYPDRKFVERAGLEVPGGLEELIAKRDYDLLEGAGELVPDELVEAFCWAGTPAALVERVAAVSERTGLRELGFWLLTAPGQTLSEAIELLAGEVLPGVRERLAGVGAEAAER